MKKPTSHFDLNETVAAHLQRSRPRVIDIPISFVWLRFANIEPFFLRHD